MKERVTGRHQLHLFDIVLSLSPPRITEECKHKSVNSMPWQQQPQLKRKHQPRSKLLEAISADQIM